MPSRGRRVAARQAKISQKKKRGRGPSGIPTSPSQPREPRKEDTAAATPGTRAQVAPATPTLTPAPAAAAPVPRSAYVRRSETRDRPLVYAYIRSELRRIALLSGAILAVLIVLAILLH